MKIGYTYFILLILLFNDIKVIQAQINLPKKKLNVTEHAYTKWDPIEGVFYLQVPGANLGAISFEILDNNRSAFLANSSNEIIIIDNTNGKAISRFNVCSAPRDFVYDDGSFFVLAEKEVIEYSQSGKVVNQYSFTNNKYGIERISRIANSTYLWLPNGNSIMVESNRKSVYAEEVNGWITNSRYKIKTMLNKGNSFNLQFIEDKGREFDKTFFLNEKPAGVFVIGAIENRVYLDVQTFITEIPLYVKREIFVIEITDNGVVEIIATITIPNCYYVFTNKDFLIQKDGTLYNMITAPNGIFIFELKEVIKSQIMGYPDEMVKTRYHFNDHLIKVD